MKALAFTKDGKTYAPDKGSDVKVNILTAELKGSAIRISAQVPTWAFLAKWEHHELALDGCVLEKIEDGRSAGAAAGGAIAGAILLGPLGALAGAAIGGKRKRVFVLRAADGSVLLFEPDSKDLAQLAARGVSIPP